MSSPSRRPISDLPEYQGPVEQMAPALMREAHGRAIARVFTRVQAEGFPEIRPAHMPVFQFPGPHGSSPVAIAQRSSRSKQHINLLLNDLEAAGYLVRRPDPSRRRGRIVVLTKRGQDLVAAMKEALEAIEAEWSARLGARRFEALKQALRDLNLAESGGS
jgi:DNA-binding MarR family transcriptional regulator